MQYAIYNRQHPAHAFRLERFADQASAELARDTKVSLTDETVIVPAEPGRKFPVFAEIIDNRPVMRPGEKPKCPFCLHDMEHKRSIFYEAGEYDGDTYEEEGDIDTLGCVCGAELAIVSRPRR